MGRTPTWFFSRGLMMIRSYSLRTNLTSSALVCRLVGVLSRDIAYHHPWVGSLYRILSVILYSVYCWERKDDERLGANSPWMRNKWCAASRQLLEERSVKLSTLGDHDERTSCGYYHRRWRSRTWIWDYAWGRGTFIYLPLCVPESFSEGRLWSWVLKKMISRRGSTLRQC